MYLGVTCAFHYSEKQHNWAKNVLSGVVGSAYKQK